MPAALTDDDKAFIRAILDDPEELTTWLVYADWLDERSDPCGEFLRLQPRATAARRSNRTDHFRSTIASRTARVRTLGRDVGPPGRRELPRAV